MHDTPDLPPRTGRRRQLATAADAPDERLRGRAYPVRFGTVWAEALRTAGALRGWRVLDHDATRGSIRAEAAGALWKRPDEITIVLSLDQNGLTRVDLRATALTRRIGGRVSRRRIARFLRALDRRVAR